MRRLFAYGTLMCPDVILQVAGTALYGQPASLQGFVRKRVRGEYYPAITEDPRSVVRGLVYTIEDPHTWVRLDSFEGEMYMRSQVHVETDDGQLWDADTYVIYPDYRHRLAREDWNYDAFLNGGRHRFEAEYRGYIRLDE